MPSGNTTDVYAKLGEQNVEIMKGVSMNTQTQTLLELPVAVATHWQAEFAAWLRENDRAENTVAAYLSDIRHFSKFFIQVNQQPFSPKYLSSADIKTYFRAQDADKAVAPRSRNRRLASLRVLVQWAAEVGYLEYDPTVTIKRVDVESRPRDKSAQEMDALEGVVVSGDHLRCTTPKHELLGLRDVVIWYLFKDAGLRVGEIAGLDIRDLDLKSGEIHVLGKGQRKGIVLIPASLVEILRTWLQQMPLSVDGALIVSWSGERISSDQVRRRLYLVRDTAEVDVKPHDLRHTYVYGLLDAMLQQGLHMPVALDAVRKQARHGDEKTTMLYLRARQSQIRAAVEAM